MNTTGPFEVAQLIGAMCLLHRSEFFDEEDKAVLMRWLVGRMPPRAVAPTVYDIMRGAVARQYANSLDGREARLRANRDEALAAVNVDGMARARAGKLAARAQEEMPDEQEVAF